jgi:hypothetical protein
MDVELVQYALIRHFFTVLFPGKDIAVMSVIYA